MIEFTCRLKGLLHNRSHFDVLDKREAMNMSSATPTDSVLRRHYEATHRKQSPDNNQSQNKGGFISWLKKIFSG